MDSHGFAPPAGYSWDHINIADTGFNSHVSLQQPARPDYTGLSAPSTAHPPAFDLNVHGVEFSDLPNPSRAGPSGKRRKFDNLDWAAHQAELRQLYLTENKTLAETMEIMKDKHSFIASQKLYKSQFKNWGWHKNLPVTHSRFMVNKANERKRQNKETIFLFGGQQWDREKAQSSLSRSKKAPAHEDDQDYPTPAGVSYKTPINYAASEYEELVGRASPDAYANPDIEMSDLNEPASSEDEDVSSDDVSDDAPLHRSQLGDFVDAGHLCINSNGLTRTELLEGWEMARSRKAEGKIEEADSLFLQSIQGFDGVMGPTHAETKKVKYECASFYAETEQMRAADAMLDTMTREHITEWGYEHKRTQQHVLHTIELLETWDRSSDALGLLSRSKEMVESLEHSRASRHTRSPNSTGRRTRDDHSIRAISDEIIKEGSLAKVEYGLGIARSHAKANDEAARNLLKAIIRHCDNHHDRFAVQHLQALAELLSLDRRFGRISQFELGVYNLEQTFQRVWRDYDWDREKFQCIELMEAAMQLASNLLKADCRVIATRIFRKVDEKAKALFGSDDERTIWMLITIGLVYQNQTTWQDAEEWFQGAFAAALSSDAWDDNDGIVKSLQNAMDKRHFSYLSDEGRPFKTIFGISGISIRPGRLHLE